MNGRSRMRTWTSVFATALLAACDGGSGNAADDADGAVVEEPKLMPDPTPVRYPPALWDRNVEGETEVLVEVNEVGDVVGASVAQTSGYAEFDSAAVAGARELRFTPAKRGNTPVAMSVRVPVRFSRDSSAIVGAPSGAGVRQ
jgi:TonB family protein